MALNTALSTQHSALTCRSAAKVNLTLDIISQRSDGYHELQSVVHTIGLWDTLTFEFGIEPDFTFRCNEPALETDDNLCLKAARAWLKAACQIRMMRFKGVRITLDKQIPSGAGLGGGSSNAAATLLALNQSFNNLLDEPTLHQTATSLGADVPLFLHGGCVLMEGIGDRITSLPTLDGWLVLLKPPHGLSTPAVYRKWDELEQPSAQGTPAMSEAIRAQSLPQVAKLLHNDLSYAAQLIGPADIEAMCASLEQAGAIKAIMTGSGSAVFGLFENQDTAEQAAYQLTHQQESVAADATNQVIIAPLVKSGIEFVSNNMVSVQ